MTMGEATMLQSLHSSGGPAGPQERHRELDELDVWNATEHEVPDVTLADLFAAQVARTPDAQALVSGETRLSYAELDALVESRAQALRALGAGPDGVVGVAVPRSIELVVLLHAVHRAGAAYLPIDTALPA